MRLVFVAAALLAIPWQAQAQEDERSREEIEEIFERGCGDDRGVDRCAAETQAKMYSEYVIEPPTELLANDVAVRRAMFVDGYGNDVATVAFSRVPGASPKVSISVPSRYAQAQAQPLEAAISQEI